MTRHAAQREARSRLVERIGFCCGFFLNPARASSRCSRAGNFNAPSSIVRAAVLYVFGYGPPSLARVLDIAPHAQAPSRRPARTSADR